MERWHYTYILISQVLYNTNKEILLDTDILHLLVNHNNAYGFNVADTQLFLSYFLK